VGTPTTIGWRVTNALAYSAKTESIGLLEEPEALDTVPLEEEEGEATAGAEKDRPGLTMFTNGSWVHGGADGYSVVWK